MASLPPPGEFTTGAGLVLVWTATASVATTRCPLPPTSEGCIHQRSAFALPVWACVEKGMEPHPPAPMRICYPLQKS